jgi:hypothetical protein
MYAINFRYLYLLIGVDFLEVFLSNVISTLDRLLHFCRGNSMVEVPPHVNCSHRILVSPFRPYILAQPCQRPKPCIHRPQDGEYLELWRNRSQDPTLAYVHEEVSSILLTVCFKSVKKLKVDSIYELYWPNDRRMSANLLPNFADRGCRVVSATDPHGR